MNKNTNKNIIYILLGTALILLVTLGARWPWSLSDFLVMGILLLGMGFSLDLVARKVHQRYRLAVGAVIIVCFFIIWAQLSVDLLSKLLTGRL